MRIMVENQAGFTSAIASNDGKPCVKFASVVGLGIGRNSTIRSRAAAVALCRECVYEWLTISKDNMECVYKGII